MTMDPNETLKDLLAWAHDTVNDFDHHGDAAEWLLSLHQWITAGGFLPSQWRAGQTQNLLNELRETYGDVRSDHHA